MGEPPNHPVISMKMTVSKPMMTWGQPILSLLEVSTHCIVKTYPDPGGAEGFFQIPGVFFGDAFGGQ